MWNQIKHVVAWLPLLWKDRDWDYGFLLEILKFKLQRMAVCIDRNDAITDKQEVCRQIYSVVNAIRDYEDDPDDEWTKHWEIYHKNLKQKLDDCVNHSECRKASNASAQREQRNWARIWTLLNKHGQNFWD